MSNDTIAAIATALGEGSIGVIRISGEKSIPILRQIFRFKSGKMFGEGEPPDRKMIYGNISDGTGIIDEAMVVCMKSPHTYTGEDIAEIQCHGSYFSLKSILSLVLSRGAVLAERGEFTKRAFLNGRLDLSQAEAVIDVVRAKSGTGHTTAVNQLSGILSGRISEIRRNMADLISEIAVRIEYPEEDLEEISYREVISSLKGIAGDIKKLADTADSGRIFRDGLSVSIVGRPNVGKSSLLNRILGSDRAIVTEVPGTTRDTIEEMIHIGGVPVKFIDTAGIRSTEDSVELIGMERSRRAVEQSDLVLFVIDASSPLNDEDTEISELIKDKKHILVLNKIDKKNAEFNAELNRLIHNLCPESDVIRISALTGEGVAVLTEKIKNTASGGVKSDGSIMVANVRHEQLLKKALSALSDAEDILKAGEALDFAESDIREAWIDLGEITGESVSSDIVDEIFSRFCLGK